MYVLDQLDNGLKIVASRMRSKDSISMGVFTKFGGRHEPSHQAGAAHFIEHMLFKGTKHKTTKQIKEEIEGCGGVLNAYTTEESTCFFVKTLHPFFDSSLAILADMIHSPLFLSKEIEKERAVILDEVKMYLDQPGNYIYDLISTLLWKNQRLGQLLAGDENTVSKLSRKDLVKYFKKYYTASNLVVSVCGDFVYEEIRDMIEKNFSKIPKGKPSSFKKASNLQTKPRIMFVDRNTEQTHFVIGYHAYSQSDPKRYPAGLLNIILGANMSSRLFEELREKKGIAYEISSELNTYADTGCFTISAGVDPVKAVSSVKLILRELNKIKEKGVRSNELRRAKDYLLGQFYMSIEDTLDYMTWLGEKYLYENSIPTREEIKNQVEKVTVEDIQLCAKEMFKRNHTSFAAIGALSEKQKALIETEFLHN